MPFIPKLRDERHTASVVPPSFAAQNRALVFPITGDDPSAHFLAAAPGRTPQRLTNRLAAGGRFSLGKAMIAELPVQSILNTPFIPYSAGTCKGKLQKNGARRSVRRLKSLWFTAPRLCITGIRGGNRRRLRRWMRSPPASGSGGPCRERP